MSATDLVDAFQWLGIFTGFWLFLWDSEFRSDVVARWKARTLLGKLAIPFEVAIATACGLLPFAAVAWLLWGTP